MSACASLRGAAAVKASLRQMWGGVGGGVPQGRRAKTGL